MKATLLHFKLPTGMKSNLFCPATFIEREEANSCSYEQNCYLPSAPGLASGPLAWKHQHPGFKTFQIA